MSLDAPFTPVTDPIPSVTVEQAIAMSQARGSRLHKPADKLPAEILNQAGETPTQAASPTAASTAQQAAKNIAALTLSDGGPLIG